MERNTTTPGDLYVYNVQRWLNETYRIYVSAGRFNLVEEDGQTGWPTIYALIRALQIELGIQVTADNFGNGTINAFKTKYPNGVQQQSSDDTTKDNIYGIIQGALLCKGYPIGANKPTLNFYEGTGTAIKRLKEHAGIDNTSSTVTLNIMKALLSMDYFYSYDNSERTQKIISMQRYLNSNYEAYIGLIPCDGIYGRSTSKAIIYAIQAEEGMSTSVANGNCGPSTKRCLPPIPYSGGYQKNGQTHGISYSGQEYATTKINKFKKLLNITLYFNGFGTGEITETINSDIVEEVQEKYSLPITGEVDYSTWLALLISCGDVDRTALACDCATILDDAKATTLYNSGYRYVGRYLSGTAGGIASKAMTKEEIQIAFNKGLKIFPIYQDGGTTVSYFSSSQAIVDAEKALKYATWLEIPTNTTIYFAVDCDPQDYQITNNILPYFQKISEILKAYKIGIYGTRNVCTRVCNAGYATSSFVSDMSTGFSGNLGFSIPDNWAYDQFATVTIGSGQGQIEIDKDSFSGQNSGFETLELQKDRMYNHLKRIFDLAMEYTSNNRNRSNELVMHYFRKRSNSYGGNLFSVGSTNSFTWEMAAGEIDNDFCNLVNSEFGYMNLTFFVMDNTTPNNEIIKYDINHLCATINALLYNSLNNAIPELDTMMNLYSGWAGDMISFAENVKDAADAGETDLIQWAKDNICKNNDTKFSIGDYYADIDAINIVNLMNEYEMDFPDAFRLYFYTPLEEITYAEKRTTNFINSVGSTSYIETACDVINEDGLGIINAILSGGTFNQNYFDAAEEGFKTFLYTEYVNGR